MAEQLHIQQTPEERVFADTFSLSAGEVSNSSVLKAHVEERVKDIEEGRTTWLARFLGSDHGVAADLYSNRKVLATLDYEYGEARADVYVTSEDGEFGDTTLCGRVSFDEAVIAAEQYVAQQ